MDPGNVKVASVNFAQSKEASIKDLCSRGTCVKEGDELKAQFFTDQIEQKIKTGDHVEQQPMCAFIIFQTLFGQNLALREFHRDRLANPNSSVKASPH